MEGLPNAYYVVYSEYDDDQTGKGWYYQDTSIKGWPSSECFATKEILLETLKT